MFSKKSIIKPYLRAAIRLEVSVEVLVRSRFRLLLLRRLLWVEPAGKDRNKLFLWGCFLIR